MTNNFDPQGALHFFNSRAKEVLESGNYKQFDCLEYAESAPVVNVKSKSHKNQQAKHKPKQSEKTNASLTKTQIHSQPKKLSSGKLSSGKLSSGKLLVREVNWFQLMIDDFIRLTKHYSFVFSLMAAQRKTRYFLIRFTNSQIGHIVLTTILEEPNLKNALEKIDDSFKHLTEKEGEAGLQKGNRLDLKPKELNQAILFLIIDNPEGVIPLAFSLPKFVD